MTPTRYQRITSVLDQRQPDLTVMLENVHKPHNLSAIMRTCDAVGILDAHAITADRPFRGNRTAASGSTKWVTVHRHQDVEQGARALRAQGYRIWAAHLSDQAVDFREVDYCQPVALLFGTEKFGVSKEGLALSDGEIMIPMTGMVPSLNVSVAAAVILYEAQRQRQAAGLYQQRRLPDARYQQILFRMGYPKLAVYFEAHKLPFPRIGTDGELLDTPLQLPARRPR